MRRLHAVLTQAGHITCSASSGSRVLRRCGVLAHRPRRPRPRWIRSAKAVPGERAQLDLTELPQGRSQLTLIAACSRLLAAFPFPVRTVQPDHPSVGRTELGQQVTAWLRGRGIRHARIRPQTPRLNGESLPCAPRRVERVYRTMGEGL